MFPNKKLLKTELDTIASILRGRRQQVADRAGVSIQTVNNTFQNLYQNKAVIKAAKEIIEELKEEIDEDVEQIRSLIADAE